jgi:hypothetical protein
MINNLLAEEQLAGGDKFAAELMSQDKSIRWDELNLTIRQAYGRYALLANEELRAKAGLGHLSSVDAFYNAYFWISIFSKRYQDSYGHDAGVEQQVFKVLESAPTGVDWRIVEEIASMAQP